MDNFKVSSASAFLWAAATRYARWHDAYCAIFHHLPSTALADAKRAGDEARAQLGDAAMRYAEAKGARGERFVAMPDLCQALGIADAKVGDALAEVRKLQSQRDDFRRQLTAEREARMAAQRIIDEVRARNRSLEAFKRGVDEALNRGDGSYRP